MTDRVPSDHPVVDSYRAGLSAVGSTNRPQLVLPTALSCEAGDLVWLSLAGTGTHAGVVPTLSGENAVRAAYANRKLARNGTGEDLLGTWLDESGLGPGTTLVLDVLTEGYAYGLREPGGRVVYRRNRPSASGSYGNLRFP